MTDFVLSECPGSPMPAVQLLRALASAGYLPEDFELFTAWLWPLTSDMLGEETLDKTFLVISRKIEGVNRGQIFAKTLRGVNRGQIFAKTLMVVNRGQIFAKTLMGVNRGQIFAKTLRE